MLFTTLLLGVYLGFAAAQCGPNGAHLQTGDENCVCSGNQVSCDAFQICGVGNTDATVQLQTTCTATVTCTNKGGNTVDVKSKPVTKSTGTTRLRAKNGCVSIPELQVTEPSDKDFTDAAKCPNPNWTKAVAAGSIDCDFSETVTFTGCSTPWTTITGSCPA
ncbi:hypothetical protein BJX96DRAFT_145892 [Aspergillus floccosus]